MNIFRGVMVSGPPGVGKTTSAHLVAKLAGFTPIELNASDARSKKLVEVCFMSCHMFDGLLASYGMVPIYFACVFVWGMVE